MSNPNLPTGIENIPPRSSTPSQSLETVKSRTRKGKKNETSMSTNKEGSGDHEGEESRNQGGTGDMLNERLNNEELSNSTKNVGHLSTNDEGLGGNAQEEDAREGNENHGAITGLEWPEDRCRSYP
ncbi:uncharacterized protein MELLADRAFT_114656 [Melampsora larici-populina 98AG31]|uniref:Uncharacterized protein n=1 Tax=Melampsora larici-populina (strain 98AG31 / pathotype 3-4-7) TaxID=747676 RepID=F4SEA7_MELLP|nr:uncharacterized protein MELLADRAFT_114656 [Melampsora larici-populina 98AG31]EGF97019.1 hypothetical protein MELLADRAFT_114656 [Melampsora larici-populina 98AG31]